MSTMIGAISGAFVAVAFMVTLLLAAEALKGNSCSPIPGTEEAFCIMA